MPIHWGTKGFSLNADVDGTHVAICFGYPPTSVYRQSVYTALKGPGGVKRKSAVPDDVLVELEQEALATGLFRKAGKDLKCVIDREISERDLTALLGWCAKVQESIVAHGLVG